MSPERWQYTPRTSWLRVLLLVGVIALVLVASGAATAPSSGKAVGRSCPSAARSLGVQNTRTTLRIIAAVRRGVPRVFRDYTTQGGGPGWHHYQVLGLVSVAGPLPNQVDVTRYWRQLMRRCGRAVAFNTWVVFLQFPEGPAADLSFAHMLVTKTRQGWVGWSGPVDSPPG